MICKHFNYSWEDIQNASYDELTEINGIGNVMAVSLLTILVMIRRRCW